MISKSASDAKRAKQPAKIRMIWKPVSFSGGWEPWNMQTGLFIIPVPATIAANLFA